MADLNKVKAVFGAILPEAHIFFATSANTELPSYQKIRKHLGKTSAHTNRGIWLKFKQNYKDNVSSTPKLEFLAPMPSTKDLTVGDTLTLSGSVKGGVAPYTYEWTKNGSVISNQTSSVLNIASVTTGNSGKFKVTVTDSQGSSIESSECTVSVTAAP